MTPFRSLDSRKWNDAASADVFASCPIDYQGSADDADASSKFRVRAVYELPDQKDEIDALSEN